MEHVKLGELIMLETEDTVGGQVRSEDTPLESIDWTRINKGAGPIYVEGVERGDTLIVDILNIELPSQGVILAAPGAGALGEKEYRPKVRLARIENGFVIFRDVRLPIRPVIGTIGVAPEDEVIPTAVPP
ncbi:MAG: acetamidase/formamidase family protein [Nitrososphaerota archaeon]